MWAGSRNSSTLVVDVCIMMQYRSGFSKNFSAHRHCCNFSIFVKKTSSLAGIFKKDRSKKYLKTKKLWLPQQAASDRLYSNFPMHIAIEISKAWLQIFDFVLIPLYKCEVAFFANASEQLLEEVTTFFVFTYFFDRSFLKIPATDVGFLQK